MKRSISVTSINSSDSVIPIEIINLSTANQKSISNTSNNNYTVQTRSKSSNLNNNNNNSNNNSNNTSLNNSNSLQTPSETKAIKRKSLSPCSLVYVDSESTNLSDGTINGNNNKNDDDISSFASSDVAYSEKSSVNSGDSLRARKMGSNNNNKDKNNTKSKTKLNYKFVAYAKEDHGNELYNVQIYNSFEMNPDKIIFSTVGSNRCSIYEFNLNDNTIDLIDSFMDADQKEIYYSCCWTHDHLTNEPLLAFAGLKGIIRTLLPFKSKIKDALFGHGSSINDLRIHPTRKNILLSASKDYTIRLWNVKNSLCVCVLGGCEGHRDEVLSADFSLNGSFIMSCSIDHSLKMWNLNNPKIHNAICASDQDFNSEHISKPESDRSKFTTVTHHFPDYSTRDVHRNYIDCVRWFGDLVMSKSCENEIVLWKPGLLQENVKTVTRTNKNVSIIYKLHLKDCDIWYMRFAMDLSQRILSLGTQNGKVYVWNLEADDPNNIKHALLTNAKSKRPIRSTSLSLNGKYLIGVNDESYIWIWKNE